MFQTGLADCEDELDFNIKLSSLKDVWERMASGFHHWFKRYHGPYFIECLLKSARKDHHNKQPIPNNHLP